MRRTTIGIAATAAVGILLALALSGCAISSDIDGPIPVADVSSTATDSGGGGLSDISTPPDVQPPEDVVPAEDDASDANEGAEDAAGADVFTEPRCAACVPDCDGRDCGGDGCGGLCGSCAQNICVEGTCMAVDAPQCDDALCGDDGLGGVCGVCPNGWTCDADRRCAPPSSDCSDVPATGLCISGAVVTCAAGKLDVSFCPFRLCEVEAVSNEAHCVPITCVPDCFGRTCGDDGCGGSCGVCAVGERCDRTFGVCLPTDGGCGEVGEDGACAGEIRLRCVGGTLDLLDCPAQGKVCAEGCGGPADCVALVPGVPCPETMPSEGHCEGVYHFACDEGELTEELCDVDTEHRTCRRVGMDRFTCAAP